MTIELTALNYKQQAPGRVWPDVTYRGRDLLKLYTEIADHFVPVETSDSSDVFLGWLPDKDVFIMGWDVWRDVDSLCGHEHDDEAGALAKYIRVHSDGSLEDVRFVESYDDLFYRGLLDALEAEHPGMIGLRYD